MQYLKLKEDISLTKKTLKTLKYNLLTALMVKYADLTEDDIKRLVIERNGSRPFRPGSTAKCNVSVNN